MQPTVETKKSSELEKWIAVYKDAGFRLFPFKTIKSKEGSQPYYKSENEYIDYTKEKLLLHHRQHESKIKGYLAKHTGFLILDPDTKKDNEWLRANILEHLHPVFTVKTLRGYHYYLKATEVKNIENVRRQIGMRKIDIIDEKKGTFIPGSVRSDTNSVGWIYVNGSLPFIENKYIPKQVLKKPIEKTGKWKEGNRNNTLNQQLHHTFANNDLDGAIQTLQDAKKSGLPEDEICRTSKSVMNTGIVPKFEPQKDTNKIKDSHEKLKKVILHGVSENEKVKDIVWIIKDFFEAGCFGLIAGIGCSGKSTLAIKLAVLNARKKPLWKDGSTGDGRRSMYICNERKPSRALNKLFACGGKREDLFIVEDIEKDGKKQRVDLSNDFHLQVILNYILKNDFAYVIFDPITNLEIDGQNKNSAVRKKLTKILEKVENKNTCYLGLIHLRKDVKDLTDLDSVRGASEWTNVSTGVHILKRAQDGIDRLLIKIKVNESSCDTHGGVRFRIEHCLIPKRELDPEAKEKTKGGIKELVYIDKPKGALDKLCKDEYDRGQKSNDGKILEVLKTCEARNEDLEVQKVYGLCVAKGVTKFYLERKANWKELGYRMSLDTFGGKRQFIKI